MRLPALLCENGALVFSGNGRGRDAPFIAIKEESGDDDDQEECCECDIEEDGGGGSGSSF